MTDEFKKAEEIADAHLKPLKQPYLVKAIAKALRRQALETLERPEVKGLVSALGWSWPDKTPAEKQRKEALAAFAKLKEELSK